MSSQKQNRGSGNVNTLFNYFSKSPAPLKKTTVSSDKKTPCTEKLKENVSSKIKEFEKPVKRELDSSQNQEEILSEENEPPMRKRRRLIIESDSEGENDNENDIKPLEVVEMKDESKENKNRSHFNAEKFHNKLKNFENENDKPDGTILEFESSAKLDETIVWPHNNLEFLKPENITDKMGRRPNHPEYNPRTLYVPEKFLQGLSPGVRQWWELKSENFDCVLFFKVGKFYELYHMDADVGVNELGCTYMRGEFAHSGFPEVSFGRMAKILVDRGYKIARVEQTETPEMMTERCKNQAKVTKFDKVVRREICQIMNKGTQILGAQLDKTDNYEANYMLSIIEKDEGSTSVFGVCFVETSIGDFYIGQFKDDTNNSRLLTLLSHYPPVLVLVERAGISLRTEEIFRSVLSNVIKECLIPEKQFWNAEKTLKFLAENHFTGDKGIEWPESLKLMQEKSDSLGLTPNPNYKNALKALGGCIWYLQKCLIEQQVLSVARFNVYYPPDINACLGNENHDEIASIIQKSHDIQYMVLDSITLNNLRIIGEEYSLLNKLDHCCTQFGKRLLHQWICSPSVNVGVIKDRQDAITELLKNSEILQELRSVLNDLPDFERHVAQIHGFGNGTRLKDHPDGRAILFEEKIYNKKKIQIFLSILKAFESVMNIPQLFSDFKSSLIVRLTHLEPIGQYPAMKEILNFFNTAFDHEEALKEGIIAPEKGIDSEFDATEEEIENIYKESQKYLREQGKVFGCKVSYFGSDKKRFQLEVPDSIAQKAGSEYVLETQRTGSNPVRRFHTVKTKEFLRRMLHAEEQRNNVLKDLTRRIFEKFSNYYSTWKKCLDSIAVLDVLCSLAEYARNQIQICVPEINEKSDKPFFHLDEGYHPCAFSSDNYVPNGISLGGAENAPLVLLTGPNMGGKSTLMRQVGLLTVMAQMGAHIPAKSCKMSVIDRIFTRLGAQDDILAGNSTFLVELNETSTILKHCTLHSLVLLDELGRGTATYDGTAIAASTVDFIANIKCRTLFSTHYRNLIDNFQSDSRITFGHMACMVENDDTDDPTEETVTFLYKYELGACPKSYGFNAAKLAGMPEEVVKKAYNLSRKIEATTAKQKFISQMLENCNKDYIKVLINNLRTHSL